MPRAYSTVYSKHTEPHLGEYHIEPVSLGGNKKGYCVYKYQQLIPRTKDCMHFTTLASAYKFIRKLQSAPPAPVYRVKAVPKGKTDWRPFLGIAFCLIGGWIGGRTYAPAIVPTSSVRLEPEFATPLEYKTKNVDVYCTTLVRALEEAGNSYVTASEGGQVTVVSDKVKNSTVINCKPTN
jgi:hypothetical protein